MTLYSITNLVAAAFGYKIDQTIFNDAKIMLNYNIQSKNFKLTNILMGYNELKRDSIF